MRVFLDMDGVVADFCAAAFKAMGVLLPYTHSGTTRIPWDIAGQIGVTNDQLWAKIDNHNFWAGLAPMYDFELIKHALSEHVGWDNVCILTSPTASGCCITGKRAWLKQHLPEVQDRVIFTSVKYMCASRQSILIDDYCENINAFASHGGHVLQVPRPWNVRYHEEPDYCYSTAIRHAVAGISAISQHE